ncbi:MAG: pyroglutamyl-peptidase I [Candidatus Bathyarchaeota archaeon]|nr:pyroglutamyl-peptidase I [Candidatus Bathyarchaeota archaeon]
MKGIILLTGFEPFGESNINPSIEACRILEGEEYNGYKIVVEEIPLRYDDVKPTLFNAIKNHKPSAIICTGQGGGGIINIERVAINVADARIPYNCGKQPKDKPIVEDGPVAYWTKVPFRKMLKAMKEAKVPTSISNSAGTFGCNHVFYELMHHLAVTETDIPAGFIHVPALPEQVLEKKTASMTLELIAEGLSVAVEMLSGSI